MVNPEYSFFHSAFDARMRRVNGLMSSFDHLTQVDGWGLTYEADRLTFTKTSILADGVMAWQEMDVDLRQANILRKDIITSEEKSLVPQEIAKRMNGGRTPYQLDLTTFLGGAPEDPQRVTIYRQQSIWSCEQGKQQFGGRFELWDNSTRPMIDIGVTSEEMFSSHSIRMESLHLDAKHADGMTIPLRLYMKFNEIFALRLPGTHISAVAGQLRDQVDRSLQTLQLPWYPAYVTG